jgi:hypothetical protein
VNPIQDFGKQGVGTQPAGQRPGGPVPSPSSIRVIGLSKM